MINFLRYLDTPNFNADNPQHKAALLYTLRCFNALPLATLEGDPAQFGTGIPSQIGQVQNLIQKVRDPDPQIGNSRFRVDKKMASVQNLTSLTDYPEFLNNLIKTIETMDAFDDEWRNFFDVRPMNNNDSFTVYLTDTDIPFDQVAIGQSTVYGGGDGDKYDVYAKWYTGGYGLMYQLVKSRNFFRIAQLATAHRQAANIKKASVVYALIEAMAATIDITWQAPVPAGLAVTDRAYRASRDAETINLAIQNLKEDNLDQPSIMPAGLNSVKFAILCHYKHKNRLKRALNYTQQDVPGAMPQVDEQVAIHQTSLLVSEAYYYVGIPMGENVFGQLLDFSTWSEFDQNTLADQTAGWESYAANIGRTAQWVRCPFA
jgi:hypothetical protein